MKAAVIGIGSNSVRMLQAEVGEGRFERLQRDREGTRLFAGLDAEGNLTEKSMRKTADAVRRMAESARENGCERLHIFATSASRDAGNGAAFLEMLRDETGVEPRILSGEEEARLSFLGATDLVPGERCGMMDIGGGSTELVIGRGESIEAALSCQVGAVRLFRQIPIAAPEDMAKAEDEAARILEGKLAVLSGISVPEVWVGTGGTFTALGAILCGVHWTDRTCLHGTRIGLEDVRGIGRLLAGMTVEERLRLPGLQPQRADIVVHGICILLAGMERLGIRQIRVSEYGNLDGFLRKYDVNENKSFHGKE